MTYGSLFAGAGGFDLGLDRAGMRCVWQVECNADANAVRRRHWPTVEQVRDVAGFSRTPKRVGHWLDRRERPDVIVGGFPCQDVSVAGKRGGLAGDRTGLWWQMLRIITGLRPRYVVWENVPGLLSSDGGRDFERVVGSLAERGYFGCVRTLDARHFGVPQRRRRLFGVFARGHLGAERCCEILALADGVRRRAAAGRAAGEGVAGTLGAGTARSGRRDPEGITIGPLMTGGAPNGHGTAGVNNQQAYSGHLVPVASLELSNQGSGGNVGFAGAERPDRTLSTGGPPGVVFAENQRGEVRDLNGITAALSASGGGRPGHSFPAVAFDWTQAGNPSEMSPTLRVGTGKDIPSGPAVLASCQTRREGKGASSDASSGNLVAAGGVRRLTPRECERLMSWPDDWTRWTHDGREIKDGPRYRLCGNGVVSNVAEWIGRRMMEFA